MATAGRTQNIGVGASLIEQALQEDVCSFEFFQAVMLLQRLRSDREPVGRFANPQDEAVSFHVNNGLAFPASQIQKLQWPEDGSSEMTINFMGQTGPMGVLPYCYTELILERLRGKDKTLESFLDIFNHRVISFYYRAWEKYRFPVTFCLGDEDHFTHHLLDLIGLGTPGLQERQKIPDIALLHYVALIGEQARSAAALQTILHDYFEVPVEIEQFTGSWYGLDQGNLCWIDEKPGACRELGKGAVVGDEIWDQQSRVRIKLGPLPLSQYCSFLPDGDAFEPLKAIVKFFCDDELDFEIQLSLKREEVPKCDTSYEGEAAPRLGWVSWLKSEPIDRDPGDTILRL